MLAIFLFLCSLLFLFWVSRRQGIEAISLYWVFAAFQCLYNITPWITSQLNLPVLPLLSDHALIDAQLILSAVSNLCFGCMFLAFYRSTPLSSLRPPSHPRKHRNFFLLVLPLFLLVCAMCAKYGWNQFATGTVEISNAGGMYTVTAYLKDTFTAIYLYYLYRFGIDRWSWVLFVELAIVMLIDGARTTFLPVAIVTCIVYAARLSRAQRRKVYALALLGVFASIAARSIILSSKSTLIENLIAPVTGEGDMGAYTTLQAIYAVQHHANTGYTYGASYLIDPLLELLPRGEVRDDYQFLPNWEHQIYMGIPGKFAPMGGFYFESEAVAAFWYLGPPLITSLFAAALIWMERTKNRHLLVYLVWAGTIGVLFAKTTFANDFKMFLTQFLVVAALAAVHRYRVFMASTAYRSPQSEWNTA
jgi:hypothetical protein